MTPTERAQALARALIEALEAHEKAYGTIMDMGRKMRAREISAEDAIDYLAIFNGPTNLMPGFTDMVKLAAQAEAFYSPARLKENARNARRKRSLRASAAAVSLRNVLDDDRHDLEEYQDEDQFNGQDT